MNQKPWSRGVDLIAHERIRQIEEEGWTPEHDAQHFPSSLAVAGASYALDFAAQATEARGLKGVYRMSALGVWPFDGEWWKPTPEDPVSQLVKAGALIAAEIDKMLRERGEQ